MTKPSSPHAYELEETIAQLTAAIAAQESRSVARVKIVRWAAIATVAAAVTMTSVALKMVNDAEALEAGASSDATNACDPLRPETMRTQACTFEQTSRFFYTMNQLMVGMA